jgi:hypothetical protein
MTNVQAEKQVSLVELLSAVPADVRIGVDDGNDWKAGTTWHPVGRLCHDASVELRRLRAEILVYHDDRLRLSNKVDRLKAAQRQWVGLSEEEIEKLKHLIDWTATWSHGRFAYEIEQLLKEKNA